SKCINLVGSSSCGPCQPEDLFKGDGYVCRRSLTCAVDNGGCDPLTQCFFAEEEGVSCGACPDGMSGTGDTSCQEIDGCAASPCFNGVDCTDVPAPGLGAVCGNCPELYVGDGRTCELERCAVEPPPCSTDPPVMCTNIPGGGFVCGSCPLGYTGDGTACVDVDECESNNGECHYSVTCENTPGGRICGECKTGYIGSGYTRCRLQTACVEDNGGCDPLVACTDTEEGSVCGDCPAGYIGNGTRGCYEIDGCEAATCYPGVHCADIPAPGVDGDVSTVGYRCGSCPIGMVGDGVTCITNMCYYYNGGCDPSVSCTNDASSPAGRECGQCPSGYTDDFTGRDGYKCEDVDGCLRAPCPAMRKCTDVPAREEAALGVKYTCGLCPSGYVLVGEACEDVDECAEANGGCWVTSDGAVKTECVNTPGGFTCGECPEGMRGTGLTGCVSSSDCSVNNGGCWVGSGAASGFDVSCTQSELGPVCGECPTGFKGSGDTGCMDIDGCAPAPCFPGVECADVPAPSLGYTCAGCPEGFRGDGEECTLCRMRVSIQYTTAVDGVVKRTGWQRGEREVIGGRNQGLDSEECVNTQGIQFWWSGATSDGDVIALDSERNKKDTLTLNLPKADLEVILFLAPHFGASIGEPEWFTLGDLGYTFQLSAAMVGNAEVAAAATSAFFVESQPLVVVIRGGELATGDSSPLTLDAGASLDPDGEEGDISFTWRCFISGGCALNYTLWRPGSGKAERRTAASTKVSVTAGSPPVPEITPLQGKFNVDEKLRLESSVTAMDVASLAYEWTVVEDRSTHALELTPGVTLSCATRFQSNLVLREGMLVTGGEYTFQLAAADSIGTGTVQMTVVVNVPPAGGWVLVTPGMGLAYTQKFSLAAPGWEDEDTPLWYQFASRVVGAEKLVVLRDFSPLAGPIVTIMPAEGLPESNYSVTVIATVRDSLGARTRTARNVSITPPYGGGVSAEDVAKDLTSSASDALWNGDAEGALVLVDGATGLLEGDATEDAEAVQRRMAMREELLGNVEAVKSALFPTSSSVERLAGSMQSLTAEVGELSEGSQAQSMALLEGLVGDTLADPAGAGLTGGGAQAICGSLASLNGVQNATRAGEVAIVMTQMAGSMLHGAASGEAGSEVVADGLAMKVERNTGSDATSPMYTNPVVTDGAAVSFPSALAGLLAPAATPPAAADCNGTSCGELGGFTAVAAVDVDTRLMVSAVDPFGDVPDARAAATSAVTTIALSAGGGDEIAVQALNEAIIFSIALSTPAGGASESVLQGAMRCAFWNATLEAYSSAGCTQLPNPAPEGASLYWRSRYVGDLPAGEPSAWALEEGTNLTAGCVESFNATWPKYGGADAGLRKYLQDAGSRAGCQLALENNQFGCWWNWTFQIFSGPGCALAEELQCYCTHLTDFKAQHEVDMQSVEPPKVKVVSTSQMASLSASDLMRSALLLSVVWGIMGGAGYLAWCSACAHNEERRRLLNHLIEQRGTGQYAFRIVAGAWSWSMFEEDRKGEVSCTTLKQDRLERVKRKEHIQRLCNKRLTMLQPALAFADALPSAERSSAEESEKLVTRWDKTDNRLNPFPLHRTSVQDWILDMPEDKSVRPFPVYPWGGVGPNEGWSLDDNTRPRLPEEASRSIPVRDEGDASGGLFPLHTEQGDHALGTLNESLLQARMLNGYVPPSATPKSQQGARRTFARALTIQLRGARQMSLANLAPVPTHSTVSLEEEEEGNEGWRKARSHSKPPSLLDGKETPPMEGPHDQFPLHRTNLSWTLEDPQTIPKDGALRPFPVDETQSTSTFDSSDVPSVNTAQSVPVQHESLTTAASRGAAGSRVGPGREGRSHATKMSRGEAGAHVAAREPMSTGGDDQISSLRDQHAMLLQTGFLQAPPAASRAASAGKRVKGRAARGGGHARAVPVAENTEDLQEPSGEQQGGKQDKPLSSRVKKRPYLPQTSSKGLGRRTNHVKLTGPTPSVKLVPPQHPHIRLRLPKDGAGSGTPTAVDEDLFWLERILGFNLPTASQPSSSSLYPYPARSATPTCAEKVIRHVMHDLSVDAKEPPRLGMPCPSPGQRPPVPSLVLQDVPNISPSPEPLRLLLDVPSVSPLKPNNPRLVGDDPKGFEDGEEKAKQERGVQLSDQQPATKAVAQPALSDQRSSPKKKGEAAARPSLHQKVAVGLAGQLKYLPAVQSKDLLHGYMQALKAQPGRAQEAPKHLDPMDAAPALVYNPQRTRRLKFRLRVALIMVRLLHEKQDLSHSKSMCRMLGVSLDSMQIRIPIHELRRMTTQEMGPAVKIEVNTFKETKAFKSRNRKTKMGRYAAKRHCRNSVNAHELLGGGYKMHQASQQRLQAEPPQPLERKIGTALLLAYLQLEAQLVRLNELNWQMTGHSFEWFVKAFRVMMGLRQTRGWYYRSIMWNFVFLQQRDGSFEVTDALATVLGAGDTTFIVNNPTDLLDKGELQESTPRMLHLEFDKVEEAHTVWATLCVVARCRTLPFMWVVNPEDPPEYRETVSTMAGDFLKEVFFMTTLDGNDLAELTEMAETAVKRWSEDRLSTIRALRWTQQASKSKIAKPLQGGAFAEPQLSVRERQRELFQEAKRLALVALGNHPWSKIMITGREEPFSRAQRILVQCTGILLMLVLCLGIYYSKATLCCSSFREAIGCALDEATPCRVRYKDSAGVLYDESFDMCSTLMESELFECDGFECDPHEQLLPHGYACTAFPQPTLRDDIYMAIFVVVGILPVQMLFTTLFTAGQQYRLPKHWNTDRKKEGGKLWQEIELPENLVLFSRSSSPERLSRACSLLRSVLVALDGAFLVLQRVGRMLNTTRARYYSVLWFVYQTRVLGRSADRVFADLHYALEKREERLLAERSAEAIFEQARNEIDSVFVQICYALLLVLWVGLTYILLVYGMLIRELMGSSTERKVLEAWVITLVFDNIVMQTVKSLTIKMWIEWLIQRVKAARGGEEFLMLWFENYINQKLPVAYRMAQSGAGDIEMEYDAAGMDF
ncbi:hypothetical protein CYMTET_13573, partial [Cymbomonas tetramitiformis]